MATASTLRMNAMPAKTWYWLKMNWADVELPKTNMADEAAVTVAIPAGAEAQDGSAAPGTFPASLEEGTGAEAATWMRNAAARSATVRVPAGQHLDEPIDIRVAASDGATAIAALDIVVEADSRATIVLHTDADTPGTGTAGSVVRVFAGDRSRVDIACVQTLADGYLHLDSIGAYAAEGARILVSQTVLGAAQSYTGFACDLAGDESDCTVDTRYLGHGAQVVDFNYVIRHHGRNTTCQLDAGGVLAGSSTKTLRGTIDLVRGCKGSIGNEHETVLLANGDVRNKTIPIILCTEDDVQGAHGASIGHINPEQLGYLTSRGLDTASAEALFEVAVFDYAAAAAPNEACRAAIERQGAAVLGEMYDIMRSNDD